MRKIAVSVIGALAIVGFMAGPAFAGQKPSGTSSGSLAIVGDPSYNQSMTLSATANIGKNVPEESVSCYVGGQQVYLNVQTGTSGSAWSSTWMLSSPTWAYLGGQSASCTAQLYYYTWQGKSETGIVYLANQSFVTS